MHGETAIIGAEYGDCTSEGECGSAYLFRFDGTNWNEEQKLTAHDQEDYDQFGSHVAVYGDSAIVTALGDACGGEYYCGAAYVYRFNGTFWEFQKKLTPNGASVSDAVAVGGSHVLIGAAFTDCKQGQSCGAAYVLDLDESCCGDERIDPGETCDNGLGCLACSCASGFEPTDPPSADCLLSCGDMSLDPGEECDSGLGCIQCGCDVGFEPTDPPSPACEPLPSCREHEKLVASDAKWRGAFGSSVSVSGDKALIQGNGAIYAFRRDGTSWSEEQKLTISDSAGDEIIDYVSLDGDTGVASAHRTIDGWDYYTAYELQFDGTAWREGQKLHNDVPVSSFSSVGIHGEVIVLGQEGALCEAGSDCGVVHVFRNDGFSWVLEQSLTASDADELAHFGRYLSVGPDVIVVGAPDDRCSELENCGATYVFRFDGAHWVEEQKLTPSEGTNADDFGRAVSLSGERIAVGASCGLSCAAGSESEAIYMFRFDGASWVEEQRLTVPGFGLRGIRSSVSLSENTVVGTAFNACETYRRCGAAFVFRFDGASWVQERKLTACDAEPDDLFGGSVSLSGNSVLVGAQNKNCAGSTDDWSRCGAAYVFTLEPPPVKVDLDIKPGSCPNPVNGKSRGVVPMAIVGRLDFDVTEIDPNSLVLSRADNVGGTILPRSTRRGPRTVIADFITPTEDEVCGCHESGGDGNLDLLIKFSTQEMARAFELHDLLDTDTFELVLRGNLNDGTTFEAVDCITIRGKRRVAGEPIHLGTER